MKKLKILVKETNLEEESTVDIQIKNLDEFNDVAMQSALEEADEQNWDNENITFEIAPLDEQEDDYIIDFIESIFEIEEEEIYEEEKDYDIELTDASTIISDYTDNLIVGIFHHDKNPPTIVKAVKKVQYGGAYYNQPGSEMISTIVAYRFKK